MSRPWQWRPRRSGGGGGPGTGAGPGVEAGPGVGDGKAAAECPAPAAGGSSGQSTISKFFAAKSGAGNKGTSPLANSKRKQESPPSSQNKKPKINGTSPDVTTNSTSSKSQTLLPECKTLCETTLSKLTSFSCTTDYENGEIPHSSRNISLDELKGRCGNVPFIDLEDRADVTNDENGDVETEEVLAVAKAVASSHLAKFARNDTSQATASVKKGTKGAASGGALPVKVKYTPLEQQVVDLKAQNPDTLLMVECGYKYRFFGDDAEIAAKELSIFCHMDHSFMTASIPVHRLFVHVRRLVAKGYKVGVVKQTETAALKAAGDNRNTPFTRQLAALYTKSTLIGEDVDPVAGGQGESPGGATSNYLMCVYEPDPSYGSHTNGQQEIAFMAVQPATGELVWDVFGDAPWRQHLETRMCHVEPVELVLPPILSEHTEKLVRQQVSLRIGEDRVRVERLSAEVFQWEGTLAGLSEFYGDTKMIEMLRLPRPVLCCLHALLSYLQTFHLHTVLKLTSNFTQFSTNTDCMRLTAATIRNLELFHNATDGSTRGSLIWVLDQTRTRFGSRLLRQWLAHPLTALSAVSERLCAVEEAACPPMALAAVAGILSSLPDLERGLTSIYHRKCSSGEFLSVVQALETVHKSLRDHQTTLRSDLQSELLRTLLTDIPRLLSDVERWAASLNHTSARSGDRTHLMVSDDDFPAVSECRRHITAVISELHDHRRDVRLTLGTPALDYVTITGTEFLVEVKNANLKRVPPNWVKINSTKALSRYHSPFIISAVRKLGQLREQLVIHCNDAWKQFLESFESCYAEYRQAVKHLATLDCILSLAAVAVQRSYTRPEVSEGAAAVHIEGGRHPVVEALLGEGEQFVPNDAQLQQSTGPRCMVVTGPNMGGKSSYIRQVALISILAQIGSFVPAKAAALSMLDGVYTRMGASDALFSGRSTLLVELQETAELLQQATPRSLVIMDELGRGTSTHDGTAIAHATLTHLLTDIKCLTLFVTHYPILGELETEYPDLLANYHMGFLVHTEADGIHGDLAAEDTVTFLYQLTRGAAARSYGLNVAQLAALPSELLKQAAARSHSLEAATDKRRLHRQLFHQLCVGGREAVKGLMEKTGAVEMKMEQDSGS